MKILKGILCLGLLILMILAGFVFGVIYKEKEFSEFAVKHGQLSKRLSEPNLDIEKLVSDHGLVLASIRDDYFTVYVGASGIEFAYRYKSNSEEE